MIIPKTILCPNCKSKISATQDAFGGNIYFNCQCMKFESYTHSGINLVCNDIRRMKHGFFFVTKDFQVNMSDPEFFRDTPAIHVTKTIIDYQGDICSSNELFTVENPIDFDFEKEMDLQKMIEWIKISAVFS